MKARGKLLFIARSAPYGSDRARALLDMTLSAAVFEQELELLFLGDGVYQLLRGQDGGQIAQKTMGNALEALELYGIEEPCVEAGALPARGLSADDLVMAARLLSAEQIRDLIQQSDVVFNL